VTYTGLMTTRYLFELRNRVLRDRDRDDQTRRGRAAVPGQSGNGPVYPAYVPKTDRTATRSAGVRLPDVSVPLATYTGWALRAGPQANDGCEAAGQFIPFRAPRPSARRRVTHAGR